MTVKISINSKRLLLASLSFQQINAQPASVLLDHYTTAEGLSNNTVWDICKSHKGYLWIGTQDGLNRFDGKNFKLFHYSANDSNSLSHNTVYKLLEDDKGYIWAGTYNGLCRYDPATNLFTRIRLEAKLQSKTGTALIGAIAQAQSDKSIWIGSRGLFFVNPASLTLEPAPGKLNEEVFADPGDIRSLLYESDERIWIGSNKGLILYNRLQKTYSIYYSNQKSLLSGKYDYRINSLWFDKQGKLWAGSWGLGLLEFDTAQKKFTGQYLAETSDGFKGGTNIIYKISQSSFSGEEDILWLACAGTSWTAFNTKTKKFTSCKAEKPYSRNGVFGESYSLLPDDLNGLWIGSEKGLYRYDRRLQIFTTHAYRYSFQNACLNYAFDAYADPADTSGNSLWIGTWSCGLFQYNLKTGIFLDAPGWMRSKFKAGISFICILRDKQGILWAGSSEGLMAMDEKKKTVSLLYPSNDKQASGGRIESLLEDNEEQLWAGTSSGIFMLDKERKNFHEIKWNVPDSIRQKLSRSVHSICSDKDGNIWFTAQNNFEESLPVIGNIKKGGMMAEVFYHRLADATSFPDVKVVNNIICDDNNQMWCASWNGLISWEAGAPKPIYAVYTTGNGLLNNYISKAEKDDKGNIWCSTLAGLSVYVSASKKFRNFNNSGLERDDIDNIFFNSRQHRLMIADWGKLHTIGTDEATAPTPPPGITISDFRVFDKAAPEAGNFIFDSSLVSLAHNRNVVTIDFTALSFYNPSQIRYAYKMEGVDKEWIQTANNSVTYNLNYGHYVFRVKGMNAAGVWNEADSYIDIIIKTPFWKTAWFYALIGLAIATLLYSIYKYRINQLKKMQAMRNNISSDLHDDIGASLSNINILNELAKRNLNDPEKAKAYLEKTAGDIQKTSENLSDIVWNINPDLDDFESLLVRMKHYAAEMLEGGNISSNILFDESLGSVKPDMKKRRHLFLIYKEALNNIVKYAKAKNADISLKKDGRNLLLKIKDDGAGFDSNEPPTGNGLRNMRHRAIDCGGNITIISSPGHGTVINLVIPYH